MFKVRLGKKQEYDDNNYFDAPYIREVMGEEVTWGSYEVELFEEAVTKIKNLKPSNSLNFITDRDKPLESDILNLKKHDEFQYNPEIIDICMKCMSQNLNLDDLLEEVTSKEIH
jgi:hypothetical protein